MEANAHKWELDLCAHADLGLLEEIVKHVIHAHRIQLVFLKDK